MFNLKKFKLNLKPLGNNVFNNMLSVTPNLTGNTNSKLVNNRDVHKKILYYDKKANAPPLSFVKKVYSRIPDDETVPVAFMTKRKYLQEYIHNQEKKNGVIFTNREKEQYINNELREMRPIVSRFTTYHNPYMPPKVVYFTDNKLSKQQFVHDAQHEFGHELYERQPKLRQNWNNRVTCNTSPTQYGRTSVDEDFAESYALYKENKLRDNGRANVLNNIKVDQASKNSQIYLGQNDDSYMMHTNSASPDKVFIDKGFKNVDFNKEQNINAISKTLGHEELHNVLAKEVSENTSRALDNIAVGALTFTSKKTGKEDIFTSRNEDVYFPSQAQRLTKKISELDESRVLSKKEIADLQKNLQSDFESQNDICFGRKPRNMTEQDWEDYKRNINVITRAEPNEWQLKNPKFPINQIVKMNTILRNDREVKSIENKRGLAAVDFPEYERQKNLASISALKEQGYDEETATRYLSEKSRVTQNFANQIINEILSEEDKRNLKEDEDSKNASNPKSYIDNYLRPEIMKRYALSEEDSNEVISNISNYDITPENMWQIIDIEVTKVLK
jgi:hypothetical protein